MGTRRRSKLLVGVAAVMTLAASAVAASPAVADASSPSITTWIWGLNAPRGITFDGNGSLYVAESGVAGTGDAGITHTGKVSKYARGATTPSWSSDFDSLYAKEDPSQPPNVLGPEGISALGSGCTAKGRERDESSGCQIRMIMSESRAGLAAMGLTAPQAGLLYRLNGATGRARSVSNVGDQMYQWTGDHQGVFPSDFPDANPYGVLVLRDRESHRVRTFVADAGANTISEVLASGQLRVVSYIPNETAAPFRDATPTCIAQGPDGMLYVATLNLLANFAEPGKSNVWRVDPDANYPTAPTLWATGLTTATACTFDRSGNFWAAEMFQPNGPTAPPGDIVRIPFEHPNQLTHFGGGMLPLPGGVAQGPDGAIYVSINSADPTPGSGAIVRLGRDRDHDD